MDKKELEFAIYVMGMTYRKAYVDGYNLAVSIKGTEEVKEDEFDNVLIPVIKKVNKSFVKELKELIKKP